MTVSHKYLYSYLPFFSSNQIYLYSYSPFFCQPKYICICKISVKSNYKFLYFFLKYCNPNTINCLLWHICAIICILLWLFIHKHFFCVLKYLFLFLYLYLQVSVQIIVFVFILGHFWRTRTYLYLYLSKK